MVKKSSTKRRHNSRRYRSGLEETLAEYLTHHQKEVRYELLKVQWEDLRYRTYTPDFLLDNGIIVEAKGLFDNEDKRKHLAIQKQHPELDIRFVFSNAQAKLYKGSKTRYSGWCEKNGFKWAHRVIPIEWLTEKGRCTKETVIKLKTQRKDI
tara:strand:- start:99 stop:554 length:456 start_codon:yes stop_codon:yes gene_type:complete